MNAYEFQGVLADLDKKAEAEKAATQSLSSVVAKGAINISVTGYETLDDRRWTLQLDNRKEETKEGQSSAAIPLLDPGIYKLRVAGHRKLALVAAEFTVLVKPGVIEEVKVEKLG